MSGMSDDTLSRLYRHLATFLSHCEGDPEEPSENEAKALLHLVSDEQWSRLCMPELIRAPPERGSAGHASEGDTRKAVSGMDDDTEML